VNAAGRREAQQVLARGKQGIECVDLPQQSVNLSRRHADATRVSDFAVGYMQRLFEHLFSNQNRSRCT
jgi:hypothetical protein